MPLTVHIHTFSCEVLICFITRGSQIPLKVYPTTKYVYHINILQFKNFSIPNPIWLHCFEKENADLYILIEKKIIQKVYEK